MATLIFTGFSFVQSPAASDTPPTYSDYPALNEWTGKYPSIVATDFSRAYRTRLRSAVEAGPNFAGHYAVAAWGCGSAGCMLGGIVDLNTGHATEFPHSTCCYEGDDAGVRFDRSSNLIVFRGVADETGDPMARYYVFTEGEFDLVYDEHLESAAYDGGHKSFPNERRSYFDEFECVSDCSGHRAGYAWARNAGISDEDQCNGKSRSFIEGCIAYARER